MAQSVRLACGCGRDRMKTHLPYLLQRVVSTWRIARLVCPPPIARYTAGCAAAPGSAGSRPHADGEVYRFPSGAATLCCTRLDRYLLREVTWTFVAVTGVLLVVLLSNQLARVLGQAAQDELSGRIVLALIGLTTLQHLTVLVPIGLFLGIVLALGRLYHESEMTAIGPAASARCAIYRPIVLLTVVVAALLALLSFRVVPAAWQHARSRSAIEALRVAQFGALEPGRFRSFAGGDAVFYAERVDGPGSCTACSSSGSVEDRIEIAMAERAEQRGAGQTEQEFVLYDGRRYEGVPGSPRTGASSNSASTASRCGCPSSRPRRSATSCKPTRGAARLGRGRATAPSSPGASRCRSWRWC